MTHQISVIIPCLNEEQNLRELLPQLCKIGDIQIVVVDGGSTDSTMNVAREFGCLVIESPKGRGRQMNAGVSVARYRQLLFLHADTRLPANFPELISNTLSQDHIAGGAFSLATDEASFGLRFICGAANLRSRWFSLPYGDQAIFTRRSQFDAVGGYPEIEIMEDYVFIRKLGRRGKIEILQEEAVTSARRWKNMGAIRTTLINQIMVIGYWLGAKPRTLSRVYQRLKGLKVR